VFLQNFIKLSAAVDELLTVHWISDNSCQVYSVMQASLAANGTQHKTIISTYHLYVVLSNKHFVLLILITE